jgi:hypothetical protein
VQITADVPRAAVQSQTQNTEQLLRNSEVRLAGIIRALSESEQGMLRQARNPTRHCGREKSRAPATSP